MSRVSVSVEVNGARYDREVEARLLLVHFLRDELGLTGTHVGCDTSNCGACTCHLDGEAVKSCTVLAVQADGAEVTTIEGLGTPDDLHPVQEAFWNNHGLQCGYCTPGMIMASADLLKRNPDPSEEEIREALAGNLCRCTGLPQHRQVRTRRGLEGSTRMTVAPEKFVGQSLRRKEDPRLITGPWSTTSTTSRPRARSGARSSARPRRTRRSSRSTSRSPSSATTSTPSSPARTWPTSASSTRCPMAWVPPEVEVRNFPHWPLARGEVNHVGDPVAVVIGEGRYAMQDAAEDVFVEYEPLPAVTDIEAALQDGSPLVHEENGTNEVHQWSLGGGDIEAAMAEADVICERRIVNHRIAGAPIEPRGVVAEPRGTGLTLTTSTQVPHFVRLFLALLLGESEEKVRVIAPEVGGGFGAKLQVYGEEILLTAAARKLGRPVKWIETRSENMMVTHHGRDQIATVQHRREVRRHAHRHPRRRSPRTWGPTSCC